MKILRPREVYQNIRYTFGYEYLGLRGAGFAFDCDKDGNIDPRFFKGEAYQACQRGEITNRQGELLKLIPTGIHKHSYLHITHAIGLCYCGRKVKLIQFTNTCQCGIEYDMSGMELNFYR